ncbi:hypothetical protein GCM10022219_13740 [Microbacterium oryzae]|uniref:Uncharacterized protein n=1 Tax=Microbacterium oryzae TaxID=743009 RepID=A0A6I6DW04_9MICO|nr:hypothetical protein [Microbacterium oryzae]QGU28286.1 hypothetical protein D7D94_11830 [Microbacterium oryzae]
MITPDWIPHRRASDGELVGWVRPAGDDWVAVSLFGADLTEPVDWLSAEEALEEQGLSWMAGAWLLRRDGRDIRVRLVEFSPDRIESGAVRPGRVVVKTDDFGAIDVPYELIDLPWPPPPELRPL